jgi:hypothetical protein
VARLLQEAGWHVVRSCLFTGEDDMPPRLEGLLAAYPLPDLDASRDGQRIWVEVKVKAAPTYTRVTGRHEHGLPLRLYEAYRRVQAITGCPVWLCVVEEATGAVLCAALDDLEPVKRVYLGPRMSRGGMVFWPRRAFRRLA